MSDKIMSKLTVAAALAGALTMATLAGSTATRAEEAQEKCYGIAKAGENNCANAAGTHSCAGQTDQNYFGGDWKLVASGTCTTVGGRLQPFDGFGQPRS